MKIIIIAYNALAVIDYSRFFILLQAVQQCLQAIPSDEKSKSIGLAFGEKAPAAVFAALPTAIQMPFLAAPPVFTRSLVPAPIVPTPGTDFVF